MKSAAISLVWFTLSKALDNSISIATVRMEGGFSLFKIVTTLYASGIRAPMVDLCYRKP